MSNETTIDIPPVRCPEATGYLLVHYWPGGVVHVGGLYATEQQARASVLRCNLDDPHQVIPISIPALEWHRVSQRNRWI